MREFRIATRKTSPIHNDVPENTTFLLFDQPSGEANTRGTLITKTEDKATLGFLCSQCLIRKARHKPKDGQPLLNQDLHLFE